MDAETYEPVPEFYAGKTVFITGGAGYLGKVLLEKLLYSCPKLDKVYVLIRDKKNVSAAQRLQNIIDLPIFSRLRRERPQDLKKIVLLKGDISAQNLNMNTEDLETVINKVSVVIHSAASIKFNDPLKLALSSNLEGTRNVLNLCHLMKNLQVLVHVSTAYCNSDKSVIEEILYPPPASIEETYCFVKENANEAETTAFLNGRPNTYTFTKALAEHLISETHGDIPVVIIRPTIVTPSKDEPVKGWVDNWFGATGILTLIGKGVCRVVYTAEDNILDLIPVDYVCNLILVAAARAKHQKEVVVYNSCSGSTNPITMKKITGLFCEVSVKNKCNELPYPNLMLCTKRYWLVKAITMMCYLIAFVADFVRGIAMNRPKFTKLIAQVVIVQNLLSYFTYHSWVIKSERSQRLFKTLSSSDAKLFPFLAGDVDWTEYVHIYFQGVKKYLLEKTSL